MALRRSLHLVLRCKPRCCSSFAVSTPNLSHSHKLIGLHRNLLTSFHHPRKFSSVAPKLEDEIKESDEPDKLYRAIDVYIKGHEDSVLESYSQFAAMAANELGIEVVGILKPKMITDRVTLLRSVFVHKKHRAQYEAQTHKRVVQLKRLTGATADTFLAYIQINIPPGVAMEVHKWEIERLPEHLEEAMEQNIDQLTEDDKKLTEKLRHKLFTPKLTTEVDYEEYKTTKPYLIGTHG